MKTYPIIAIACAGLLMACASVPPAELVSARRSYAQASNGQANRLVPAEVHKAFTALSLAEESFKNDPDSYKTRDLAYVADRKAMLAEALAVTVNERAATVQADKDYQTVQTQIMKSTKDELAAAERSAVVQSDKLAAEQGARVDAEAKAADARTEAARVKDSTDAHARMVKATSDAEAFRVKGLADAEARRMAAQKVRDDETILRLEKGKKVVLTGVTFQTNKATLTGDSEPILSRAYNALVANPDAQIEISGHTDNVGDDAYNQSLSLERAQTVKNWLVRKGIASQRMKTVGKGENEPVGSNTTTEGRASNRRIEFYVE